jgi:hypothetical protein
MLGIRNEYQAGLGWKEVASLNRQFLRDHTNYPTTRATRRIAQEAGVDVQFIPGTYLAHHPGAVGRLSRLLFPVLPGVAQDALARMISAGTQRCMVLRPMGKGEA